MKGFDPATSFRDEIAARYDGSLRGDEDDTVAFLARLAGDGPALELAIGTGRVALPLREAGVAVDGIELSPDMIAQLRAKAGGDAVNVVVGDMATADAPGGPYALVFLVYNTIGNVITQDGQVDVFANAARHLAPGGAFVVENTVPDHELTRANYVDAENVEADRVVFDVCRYDPVTQVLDENHVELTAAGIRFSPVAQRLAGPGELDLMARLAGLRLAERWAGWCQEPFDARATRHVSVYRRDGDRHPDSRDVSVAEVQPLTPENAIRRRR